MQLQAEEIRSRKAERSEAASRKAKRQRHMVTPSAVTATHERKLRRVATKGVVALFNAVRKYQADKLAVETKASGGRKTAPAAVKAMQAASRAVGDMDEERSAFMDMLKESTAKEAAKPAPATGRPSWEDETGDFGTFEEL